MYSQSSFVHLDAMQHAVKTAIEEQSEELTRIAEEVQRKVSEVASIERDLFENSFIFGIGVVTPENLSSIYA